ncbi:MAG: hypothetical protein QM758_04920 [Armatimonas sp.]
MFGFIGWAIIALASGIVARAIMPGKLGEPSGWIGTIALGALGAALGNWVNKMLFVSRLHPAQENLLINLFLAVFGACAIILALRLVLKSRQLLTCRQA